MTEQGNTEVGNQQWDKDPELESLYSTWDLNQPSIAHDPLLPGVTARIIQRRRHRRGAAAVAAVAVLVGGAVTAYVVAGDRGVNRGVDPTTTSDDPGLTIRYTDKVYTFSSFTDVACATHGPGHDVLRAVVMPKDAIHGRNLTAPILSFEARPDLVTGKGPTFNLPEAAGESENNAFTLFTAVPITAAKDNEASSQEPAATGTVTITNLTCGPDPTFTLTADADLGSEVGGATIPINGSITYP